MIAPELHSMGYVLYVKACHESFFKRHKIGTYVEDNLLEEEWKIWRKITFIFLKDVFMHAQLDKMKIASKGFFLLFYEKLRKNKL